MALAASGEPNKILTLTVNPERGGSPLDRRNMLHDAWKKLVKRIIRRFKFPAVHYLAFLERTKRGEPHLHILLRCPYIPQRWLAGQMRDLIGAPICWIEKIKGTRQAIKYVTKYVTKEPAQFGKGKRYWVSRNYEVAKADAPEREPRDMRGVRVQRERWSDFLASVPYSVAHIRWIEDGWIRVWRNYGWRDKDGKLHAYDPG